MQLRRVTDQMGREVIVPASVKRIVSLVPSQTELLVDLGLEELLVGVTKFCIHPKGLIRKVGQIGGTKSVNIDEVLALQPDLVIGNKEENLQSDIEELEKHLPVWMSDIANLDDATAMIQQLGVLLEAEEKSLQMIDDILLNFSELNSVTSSRNPQSVIYLIWRNPYMAAGKGTFIDDCLQRCGLENCVTETRYPEITLGQYDPRLILLSSEPYPFGEKHVEELQSHYPNARIELVDGEYFSWYGSRMLGAPDYFRKLLHRIDHQG